MFWKCNVAVVLGAFVVAPAHAQPAQPAPSEQEAPPPTETPDLATLFGDGGALSPGYPERRAISTAPTLVSMGTMGSGKRDDQDRAYVTAIFNPSLAVLGKWSARVEVAPFAAHALFVEGSLLHLKVPGYDSITVNGQAVEFGYHLYPFGNGLRGFYLGPRLFFASGSDTAYARGTAWGYGFDLGYQIVLRPIALNFGLGVGYAMVKLKATETLLQTLMVPPEYKQLARDITLKVSSVIPVLTIGIGFGYLDTTMDNKNINPAIDEIRSYRLDPQAFESTVNRRIISRLPWIVVVLIAMMGAQMFWLRMDADLLLILISILFISLFIGIFRARQTQLRNGRKGWNSYLFTLGPNLARRHIDDFSAMEITRFEVNRIVERPGEGIILTTLNKEKLILIPEQLVNYDEVRLRLTAWRTFEPAEPTWRLALMNWRPWILLGSWGITCFSPGMHLAAGAAGVLVVMSVVMIRELLKTKLISARVKASGVRGLVMLLLTAAASFVAHFFFHVKLPWNQ